MPTTDVAGALADTSGLSDFEGLAVRQVGIEIPGVAGGLRDPLRVDPQEWHKGNRLYVVIEAVVADIKFKSIDKDDPAGDQQRVHVLAVESAAIVDRELVAAALEEQKRRVTAAQEAAAGVGHLPTDEAMTEAVAAHADGLHASGLVPGCPTCESELAAMAAEAEQPPAPTPIAGRAKRARKS